MSLPTPLPVPLRDRWQPLRSGFLNVFRFQNEEFWYDDGHLLLRGNNGSGKSRILALQLPFLLDGDTSPHRLEPDGDAAKRIEWNLLMGKHPDRRGYTWLELGRLDEAGEPCFLTIGCGLYAVEGRPLTRWFFVTPLRVGAGLSLLAPSGEAIARDALAERIGPEQVFTRAADYRKTLDQQLFKLGEHRYAALINLLIQLRQPQLSRDLDEGRLSSALGEALPPPDGRVLADVAEAFRELEADRLQLQDLAEARRATEAFHQVYHRYAQIALRRRATGVRQAQSRYEALQRDLKAAETRQAEAQAALEAAEGQLVAFRQGQVTLTAEIEALRTGPEMRSAAELDAARQAAEVTGRLAGEATGRATRDGAAAERRGAELAAQAADLDAAGVTEARGLAALRQAARLPGLAQAVEQALAVPAGASRREPLSWAADDVRGAQRLLKKLCDQLDLAARAEHDARGRQDAARAAADEAAERVAAAREAHEVASQGFATGTRAWAAALVVLAPLDAAALAEGAASWAEAGAGPDPVSLAARGAWERAMAALAAERAASTARRAIVADERAALAAERSALEAGGHRPPEPGPTRDPAGRADRPGAPFWRLIDFRPEVSAADQAGLEAALEAAGLLDAWVAPDGQVEAPGLDAWLEAPAADAQRPDLALDAWLRPDAAAEEVAPAVVARLLGRIGGAPEAGDAWVSPSGAFALGPLRGAWRKPAAAHIGQSAREAERLRRLAELAAAIAAHDEALAALAGALAALATRQAAADAELAAVPAAGAVIQALAGRDAAGAALAGRERALAEAEGHALAARQATELARQARDASARDLGLADWVADLPGLAQAIAAFEAAAERWLDAAAGLARAEDATAAAAVRRDEAAGVATASLADAAAAEERRAAAASRFATLEALVGVGVKEVLVRLVAAQGQAQELAAALREAEARSREAFGGLNRAEGQAQQLQAGFAEATIAREAAVGALALMAERELWEVALDARPEPPEAWTATRAVDLARQVERQLEGVAAADGDWTRAQQRMQQGFTALGEALTRQDLLAEGEPLDELFLVSVAFRERRLPVHALRAELVQEVTARQTILSAREKELLENHLVGEVAEHLHERLHEAEKLVAEMNREILRCETSTGMTLRFRWAPVDDGAPGLREALDKLRRRKLTWSLADRELLGAFLQERIAAERAKGAGSWHEQLAHALDYRAWHQFSIERKQEGDWKRLTRRTHGTGSGGEKAIALTIPQFAAAAAHYRSADPAAPRLILLDEAFVGVDKAMRSKCMGLIQAFDLDFVMTSESEWACYATLPGVAIYQLAVRAGIDAVHATRWVWNGRERLLATPALAEPAPSAAAPAGPDAGDGQLALGL